MSAVSRHPGFISPFSLVLSALVPRCCRFSDLRVLFVHLGRSGAGVPGTVLEHFLLPWLMDNETWLVGRVWGGGEGGGTGSGEWRRFRAVYVSLPRSASPRPESSHRHLSPLLFLQNTLADYLTPMLADFHTPKLADFHTWVIWRRLTWLLGRLAGGLWPLDRGDRPSRDLSVTKYLRLAKNVWWF